MKSVLSVGALALILAVGGLTLPDALLEARQAGAVDATVPTGAVTLGNVTIPRNVMADGQPLASGTYSLRLTGQEAAPPAVGQTPQYERWVEFLRGDTVAGREVVSIVPASEIQEVAQGAPLATGGTRVELLRGNDYLRIWLNRGGVNYFIHLPTGLTAS